MLLGIAAGLGAASCAQGRGPARSPAPAGAAPAGSSAIAIGGQAGAAAVPPAPAQSGDRAASPPFLPDEAIRALLSDVSVTPGRTALSDDYSEEIFRANGLYHRIAGRGSALGVPFEVRDGAVCVPNGDAAPRCRRIRPDRDGSYAFVDAADGSAAVMTIAPLRGAPRNGTSEPAAPLPAGALRALLVDAIVAADRGGDDGPFELFLANGVYQRGSGWGLAFEGRFEVRDDAVCVLGDGPAPRCRRVLANADGTYTFVDTTGGGGAVMTVTRRR